MSPHRETRPVLALHCSLAHGGAFTALSQLLPGVSLNAPDLMGHGKAPDWDRLSDYHAAATEQALAATGGQAIDIIGHSFGGTVALRLALERPELVRSLTLIEPVLFAAAKAAQDPAWDGFIEDHRAFGGLVALGDKIEAARQFHAMWGGDAGFDSLSPRMQSYMSDRIHLITAPWNVILDDAPGLLAPGRLEGLTMPVLLLQGQKSPPIIVAVNRALSARLPRARSVEIAGAGHMLPISHAAEVAPVVQAHLDAA